MFLFHKNLTHIKWKLKEWNKTHFKNIFAERDQIEKELRTLNETVIEKGMSKIEFIKEHGMKDEQVEWMAKEEKFWRYKSREVWLKEGD